MGWFWGSSGDNDDDKSKDPLRRLDPSLRDFLKKESPVKYGESNPPAAPTTRPTPSTSSAEPTATSSGVPFAAEEEPKVPRESLFQDGRYAHLWKNYQPQSVVEEAGKSDQEKISDVLEGYKHRKAEIGRAALENCAMEQWEQNECFTNGSWGSRMTMCRTESKKLERCYLSQSKFLRALGYLSIVDRPAEVDEQIQMHADTLYHRMLEQEAAVEAAKAEGRPIPKFPAILTKPPKLSSKDTEEPLEDNKLQPSDLNQRAQKAFKKRLDGLPEAERELEERAIKAEIRAGEQVAGHLEAIYEKQEEERKRRKEAGKETVADRLSSILRAR